ncbi:DUF4861 family protein [Microbulbifer bruguierae]|uniref:DUF4861 family protein n=1 Tax=Microbulbifer bruguierae TaxID=3029061 RepID=A0ABY8NA54_9GAMM|nr:DUF4861 family protein [Microbulbifer bruguierae]WGL15771.1 DUF4861 family protein [Microbulbifer bruguierae]
MLDFTQKAVLVATATLISISGCADNSDSQAAAHSEPVPVQIAAQSASSTSTYGTAPGAAIGTYAELAVRRGGVPGEDGKLQGGEYVPVEFMQLPDDHQIGNRLFKYEGPGWESEQVAYRLYFDERAAIDIFGKTKPQLVLPQVGQDGTDYHALADWGMDVLKVGPSLGIGGVGVWHQGKLEGVRQFASASVSVFNEADASGVQLQYSGWKAAGGERDLEMTLRIAPGSRLTQVHTKMETPAETWATGIVRHGLEPLVSAHDSGEWGYLATWGAQSLAGDNLGMAIFFRNEDLQQITDDEYNHLVLLNGGSEVQYQFAAVWRDENVQNREQFVAYLNATALALSKSNAVVSTDSSSIDN